MKFGYLLSFFCLIFLLYILNTLTFKIDSLAVFGNSVSVSEIFDTGNLNSLILGSTVRLVGATVTGSGVIIAREKNQYDVLTCAHVVDSDIEKKGFHILTYDKHIQKVNTKKISFFKDLDLALLTFYTNSDYPVASLSQSSYYQPGIKTYVSGYPNLIHQGEEWKLTHNMGIKHYFIDQGKITLILPIPLLNGYQIGLSNEVHQGMSGGPVFNNNLKLIGIIGRSKYGGNRDFYQLSDGTYPSKRLWEEMEESSWAIPIYPILHKLVNFQNLK